jgi:hypothetical protein
LEEGGTLPGLPQRTESLLMPDKRLLVIEYLKLLLIQEVQAGSFF